ncbi:MAG: sigma-54-dependent Fis family transcriptional regulator [Burkholderiaceae bacterium]
MQMQPDLMQIRRDLLEHGTIAPGAMNERLARSWQRCLQAGLLPQAGGGADDGMASGAFACLLEHHAKLLAIARPVMDFFYTPVRGSQCMLVLADAQGTLLHTVGDIAFLEKAQRVALRCGVSWSESQRGTNAIGTVAAERSALQVHGGEHYLLKNGFLHCSAAPLFDAQGGVAGIIDISGDEYASQPHALGLACGAARLIENNWLKARFAQHPRIHLHGQAEGLHGPGAGMLALTHEGILLGANPEAARLLNLKSSDFGALRVSDRLQRRLTHLLARGGREPQLLRLPDGRSLYLQVHMPPTAIPAAVLTPRAATPEVAGLPDALARRDTGDARWHDATVKTRRILGKPIALLIQGESGVGKEVFARACHDSGPRRGKPFVAINCAAMPESLIEAELFGYAPGAYTGAQRGGSLGRIREAEGGTLLLDEIGHMPLLLQTRLLRVLQEHRVTPLGGTSVAVDFALMSATHRALDAAVAAGEFRSDLYYRINGFNVQLPPLRERTDFDALVALILAEYGGAVCTIAPDLRQAFLRYAWPGNLRQLANVLQTACALREPGETSIDFRRLSDDLRHALQCDRDGPPRCADAGLDASGNRLKALARQALHAALDECQGNVSAAAKRLGISRQTIYRRLRDESA